MNTRVRDGAWPATAFEGFMQYDEIRLAQLAATVAAGFARDSKLLSDSRTRSRRAPKPETSPKSSLMVARHIMVAAHDRRTKVDELELLYDDADYL